jgi:hypothetical protein
VFFRLAKNSQDFPEMLLTGLGGKPEMLASVREYLGLTLR